MSPPCRADARSIFFKDEQLQAALTLLPYGVILPKSEIYEIFPLDGHQREECEEHALKTPHQFVGDTIDKLTEILERRVKKKLPKKEDSVLEDEFKYFFEDLHFKLIEKKRFFLKGIWHKLPNIYNVNYSLNNLSAFFKKDIEKVFFSNKNFFNC